MQIDFTGRTALVTGASRGIGQRIALDLVACGADVVLTSTGPMPDLAERFGPSARHQAVDFHDAESIRRFLAEVRTLERLDVLVNNAATTRHKPIAEVSEEDWDVVADVNLKAPYFLSQAAAEVMRRRGEGRIVHIASIWAHTGKSARSTYAATKYALRGLTAVGAVEWAGDGILVNTVSPGFTLTDMLRRNYTAVERAAMCERVPLGRMAEPAEVSRAVLFLASPLNTYITGQSLLVDGGYTVG